MYLELTIIGYVGADATTNFVNGKQVINFSVCHTRNVKKGDEKQEIAQWISCAFWSESKLHEYIKKGTLIHCTGLPSVKPFVKDKNELDVHFNLICNQVTLLNSPKENEND